MGFLRNILFVFCFWSVGTTLFAATSCLLDQNEPSYVDPQLPKFKADLGHALDQKLNLEASSAPSAPAPAILQESVIVFPPTHDQSAPAQAYGCVHKPYLFTYSGTSPPSVS